MSREKRAKEKSLEKALSGAVNKVLSKFKLPINEGSSSEDDDFQAAHPAATQPPAKRRKKTKVTLPSAFVGRKNSGSKIVERLFTYDRDIICLPKSLADDEGLIKIPRKHAIRDFLAANKLVGKIRLTSAMSEDEIMDEIRSVFAVPMEHDQSFRFKILQPSGGGSKSLAVPELSMSYKWSASSVAGKNTRVPIYILAEDKLKVVDSGSDEDEKSDSDHLPDVSMLLKERKKGKEAAKKSRRTPHSSTRVPAHDQETLVIGDDLPGPSRQSSSTYSAYVSLLSDDEDEALWRSPSPPPMSPLTSEDESANVPLPTLLRGLLIRHLPVDRSECQRIVVRRKHIWNDALSRLKQGIDVNKYLKVTFVGEPGV